MDEGEAESITKKETSDEVGSVIGKFDKRFTELKDHIKKDRETVGKPWEPEDRHDWALNTLLKQGEMWKCDFTGGEDDGDQGKIATAVAQFFYEKNQKVFKKWYERKRKNGKFLEKITAGQNEYMLYKEAKNLFEEQST